MNNNLLLHIRTLMNVMKKKRRKIIMAVTIAATVYFILQVTRSEMVLVHSTDKTSPYSWRWLNKNPAYFTRRRNRVTTLNSTTKTAPYSWTWPNENPAYFTRRKKRVTPLDFNFLISSEVCKDDHVDPVMMILSMASHREYRDAIRDTWGGVNVRNTWAGVPLTMKVKLVFVFGLTNKTETASLMLEAKTKHDLILTDIKEDYFNLTYKVLMGFKWIKENCESVKFIMKSDEDSIVHIPWLLERLHLPPWNSRIVGCYFTKDNRLTEGKYAVNPNSYPFEIYPPHVKGNVYIMPSRVAYQIVEVSEYMPYFIMEDVQITGILARSVGASHTGIPSEEYYPYGRPQVCDVALRRKFAGRDLSPKYMREVWSKVLHPKSCSNLLSFILN